MKGSDYAHESWESPNRASQWRLEAIEQTTHRERGDGAIAGSPMMDDRARRIFEEKAELTFAYVVEVDGVNWRLASTCSSNLVESVWWPGALTTIFRRSKACSCQHRSSSFATSIKGWWLLAGVTGSEKARRSVPILNYINSIYSKHILTLEDPIEFVFTEDKCLINQREIGGDVKNFEIGMKHAVRETQTLF